MSKVITIDERQADMEKMLPGNEQMMTAKQLEQYDDKYWRFDFDTSPSLREFCYDGEIDEGNWFSTLSKEERKIAKEAFEKAVWFDGIRFIYFEDFEEGGTVNLPFITLEEANEIMEKLRETVNKDRK